MIYINAKLYKKKWLKNKLKNEKIFYFNILNHFFIINKESLFFSIPEKILRIPEDSIFFKEELNHLIDLYIKNTTKNFNILKIKYNFEKENDNFNIYFTKKYEYYVIDIYHKNNDLVYSFNSYLDNDSINNEIDFFKNLNLKMSEKRFDKVKEKLKKEILNGYDISFKNYYFELETEDDLLYTAIFENINSGKCIVIKNIKLDQEGNILSAGDKNNELVL